MFLAHRRDRIWTAGVLILALAVPLRAVEDPPTSSAKRTGSGSISAASDERPAKSATIFLGSAIDNFAAGELRHYLNPDASSEVSSFERLIGGIQFSWRLPLDLAKGRQIWLYGWTVHGVRSADVDCAENSTLEVCQEFTGSIDPTGQFLYLVRDASSLEAAGGLRWEFLELGDEERDWARLFLSGQEGFLTVSGTDGDVIELWHVGVGLISPTGPFKESYLEVGYGGTELFALEPSDRWKVNGFLAWAPEGWESVQGFARISVDADFRDGPDSVQSYFGLRWDVRKFLARRPRKSDVTQPATSGESDLATQPGDERP